MSMEVGESMSEAWNRRDLVAFLDKLDEYARGLERENARLRDLVVALRDEVATIRSERGY